MELIVFCLYVSVCALAVVYIWLIKGSPSKISLSLACGACSFGILSALETLLFKIFIFRDTSLGSNEILNKTLFISFVEAGLIEEFFKTLSIVGFLLLVIYKMKRRLNRLQIFLVCVLVGLGFGFGENIVYAYNFLDSSISIHKVVVNMQVLFLRNFSSVIAHMIMTGLFGLVYLKTRNILWAFCIAVLSHGLYDFLALPQTILGHILIEVYLGVGVCYIIYCAYKLYRPGGYMQHSTLDGYSKFSI